MEIIRGLLLLFWALPIFSKQYVTCAFKGQLGNQMFEMAAAIAYALDHDCEYSFPSVSEAINGELNLRYVFHRINTTPFPEGTQFHLYEHDKITNSHVFAPIPYFEGLNVKLDGHCITEKYFARHSDTIRSLFAPTEEMVEEIRAKYEDLLQERTVAIHVRTYIPDHFHSIFNTPQQFKWARWHYFINAISKFPADSHFLVFSDDIEWTKKNFPRLPSKITFIEGNSHIFDFYFISLCDHQIVSPGSTYSWWGAWLNKNPDKIVIAPDYWWDLDETDTIPDSWTKIPRYPR